jgi:hypothetical protein
MITGTSDFWNVPDMTVLKAYDRRVRTSNQRWVVVQYTIVPNETIRRLGKGLKTMRRLGSSA